MAALHMFGAGVFVVAALSGLYALSKTSSSPGKAAYGCVISAALFAFSFAFLAL